MSVSLEIYVESDCSTCAYAYELAERVRREMPWVEVRVVDVTDPRAQVPTSVFAVPTYLLNGRTISLGNPREADLLAALRAVAADSP